MKKIFLVIILSLVSVLYAVTPIATLGLQHSITNNHIQIQYYLDIGVKEDVGAISVYVKYRNEFGFVAWEPLLIDVEQDFLSVGFEHDINFATFRVEHTQVRPFSNDSDWIGGGYTRFEVSL